MASQFADLYEKVDGTNSFTLLLDSDQKVARRYQTFRFPESLLIGRDGVILERYVGSKEWDSPAYLDRIRRLLAGADDTGS